MAQSGWRSLGNRAGEDYVRYHKEGKFRDDWKMGDEESKWTEVKDVVSGVARLGASKGMIQCY